MWTATKDGKPARATDVVAGIFHDDVSARDAIAELKLAGFSAERIAVALSKEGKRANKHLPTDMEGKHSILWRIRHSLEHDTHTSGPGLTSKDEAAQANVEAIPFTAIDLVDTLTAWGIAPVTIDSLNREIHPDGLLILVDARERREEVSALLEKNRGIIRTSMVTEPSHVPI